MCLPILGPAIGLVGSVVSGAAAASAMNQKADNYDAQAAMQDREADIDIKTGAYEAARTADTIRRTTGTQRAGYIANGVALTGSADDVIGDTLTEGALDLAAIRWNSQLKHDESKYEAKISRANASEARSAAGLAFIAPVIGGVAKFAGSF